MYQILFWLFLSSLQIKTVLFIFCLHQIDNGIFAEQTTIHTSSCTYKIVINQQNKSQCPTVITSDQYGANTPHVSHRREQHHKSYKTKIIDDNNLSENNEDLKDNGEDFLHQDIPATLPLHTSRESRLCQRRVSSLVYRLEHLQQVQRNERERGELYANSVKGHNTQLNDMGTGFVKLESNVSSLIKAVHSLEQKLFWLKKINNNLEHKMASVVLDMDEVHKNIGRRDLKVNPGIYDVDEVVPEYSAACSGVTRGRNKYEDCSDIKNAGYDQSGEYFIQPRPLPCSVKVWCDMKTDGGGWTTFQRRIDGTENFYRNWTDYRAGFGRVAKEFWWGNNNLFLVTNQKRYELRVELWDYKYSYAYAKYRHFKLDGERDYFRLHVSGYSGTARNALYLHNFASFSTIDRDHDKHTYKNCAKDFDGGWWFTNCYETYLNGRYHVKKNSRQRGIAWNSWKHEQLMRTEMKFRPARV